MLHPTTQGCHSAEDICYSAITALPLLFVSLTTRHFYAFHSNLHVIFHAFRCGLR